MQNKGRTQMNRREFIKTSAGAFFSEKGWVLA